MYVYPTRPVLLHSAFTLASSTPLLSFLALHLFPLLCSTSYSLLSLSLSLSLLFVRFTTRAFHYLVDYGLKRKKSSNSFLPRALPPLRCTAFALLLAKTLHFVCLFSVFFLSLSIPSPSTPSVCSSALAPTRSRVRHMDALSTFFCPLLSSFGLLQFRLLTAALVCLYIYMEASPVIGTVRALSLSLSRVSDQLSQLIRGLVPGRSG